MRLAVSIRESFYALTYVRASDIARTYFRAFFAFNWKQCVIERVLLLSKRTTRWGDWREARRRGLFHHKIEKLPLSQVVLTTHNRFRMVAFD